MIRWGGILLPQAIGWALSLIHILLHRLVQPKGLGCEELRGKAAMVMQKAQLFGGTIRSNLLWGNKNATDADLWAALETAQAAEFVKAKPLGLDEPCLLYTSLLWKMPSTPL